MFQHLIVPVDGSVVSWQAVMIAAQIADGIDASVEIVQVIPESASSKSAITDLEISLARLGPLPRTPEITVRHHASVAHALGEHLTSRPNSIIAMSTRGQGRVTGIFGSCANDILTHLEGPIMTFGPRIAPDTARLSGNYIVPIDGSRFAEHMAPIAAQWANAFGGVPWLVEVVPPGDDDAPESEHLIRTVKRLSEPDGPDIHSECLQSGDPGRAIWNCAKSLDASLVFMSTHGRTGLARIMVGSVASAVIREASIPVVLYRPFDLIEE